MYTIETDFAETALWKLADNLPAYLIRMAKEEPEALLDKIERKVEDAQEWEKQALKRGMVDYQAREYMIDMWNPSYHPEYPEEIIISEYRMNKIRRKLIAIAKNRHIANKA